VTTYPPLPPGFIFPIISPNSFLSNRLRDGSTTAINGVNFQSNSADYGPDIYQQTGATLTSLSVVSCSSLGLGGLGPFPPCTDFTCQKCTKKVCYGDVRAPTTPLPLVPIEDPFVLKTNGTTTVGCRRV